MEFFKQVGKLALGSRVRFLADMITQDAFKIYSDYQTNLHPKWFPVFYVLSKSKGNSVTEIAQQIGHSHVSVSKIIAEMMKAGLIVEKSDLNDRRRTEITLSKKGKSIAQKIELQYKDVNAAIEEVSQQANHNLWAAIEEWEELLKQKSLYNRVIEKKKSRESVVIKNDIKIEAYQPKYKKAFYDLNKEWISKYFKMEEPDRIALLNPQKYIIDRGGYIFVATLNKKPVGVCAIITRDDKYPFELAKMAVAPEAQRKNIGYMLGRAAIEKATELNAKFLYLESNTILVPAIRLYEKLGFKRVKGLPTPYERCNIQMELKLNSEFRKKKSS